MSVKVDVPGSKTTSSGEGAGRELAPPAPAEPPGPASRVSPGGRAASAPVTPPALPPPAFVLDGGFVAGAGSSSGSAGAAPQPTPASATSTRDVKCLFTVSPAALWRGRDL